MAALQGANWPVEVSVNVTAPAEVSAADGLYVALRAVAPGTKVPVPEDVQRPPVAPPPTVPPRLVVALLEQIVWLGPALAVAALAIVMVIELVTSWQGADSPVALSVTVAAPAVISADVGW
jgi:hypothetical protein